MPEDKHHNKGSSWGPNQLEWPAVRARRPKCKAISKVPDSIWPNAAHSRTEEERSNKMQQTCGKAEKDHRKMLEEKTYEHIITDTVKIDMVT